MLAFVLAVTSPLYRLNCMIPCEHAQSIRDSSIVGKSVHFFVVIIVVVGKT